MYSLIYCTNCGKSGMFGIEFIVTYSHKSCVTCHNHESLTWRYHFCDLECQMSWITNNHIITEGVNCRDCTNLKGESTGFFGGYESNGVCKTCDGKTRVKI